MFGFFLLLPAVATFAFYEDYTSLLMVTTILISFVFFYLGAGFSYRVSAERVLKLPRK
jgi:predicted Na+-dependent transporter